MKINELNLLEKSHQNIIFLLNLFNNHKENKIICEELKYQLKLITDKNTSNYLYLIYLVKRHNLSSFLYKNKLFKSTTTEFQTDIKNILNNDVINNLKLKYVLQKVVSKLQKENIRFLIIKGIAYSKIIHNDIFSRGNSRDIDIFIGKDDINKVVKSLEDIGFINHNIFNERNKENIFWTYFRNNFENSLVLIDKNEKKSISIDIHWGLSIIRNNLPNFEQAYQNKQLINLDQFEIYTLSSRHAFLHSCVHASIDQWMNLMNLIDINAFSKLIETSEINRYKSIKHVKLSLKLAKTIFNDQNLKKSFSKKSAIKNYVIKQQLFPRRFFTKKSSPLWNSFNRMIRLLSLSDSLRDHVNVLVTFLFPTREFSDLKSKNFLIIPELFLKRLMRLFFKLKLI